MATPPRGSNNPPNDPNPNDPPQEEQDRNDEETTESRENKSLSGQTLRKATIAVRAFPYRIEAEHQYEPGKFVYEDRTAYRGEEIDLLPFDHSRGVRLGAFLKPGQKVEDLGTGGASVSPTALQFSAKDATDTELINWIKDGNPTVQDVIDASEGDAETAERLLSAETAATGNDPRKGVVMGLESVVNRSNE